MVDYREILRLHHEGYSQRQIERSVGSSRHTITQMLNTATALGMRCFLRCYNLFIFFRADRLFPHTEYPPRGYYVTLHQT